MRRNAIARSVADHQGIVDALRTRDSRAAVAAMRRHLDQVHRTTRAAMKSAQ
jgi:DNA-binding GntR family transcriptional regulator